MIRRSRLALKTYSHLAPLRRMPSDYEIVTSQLLHHVARGFEVNVPLTGWYERFQKGSPLVSPHWDEFRDPRESTYSSYVRLQAKREAHVEEILRAADEASHDARLSATWIETLEVLCAPLRYAFHGLQMISAYIGQMAPSGRIAIASLLQSADELRRIHRLAYRIAQLRRTHPRFADGSKAVWQGDPRWQPLRRTVELALVAYDWGEAFVALNVCLKPLVDTLFMRELAGVARAQQDHVLSAMLVSFDEDCTWQRSWTTALVRMALSDAAPNRQVLQRWIALWLPRAREALASFDPLFPAETDAVSVRVNQFSNHWLQSLDLKGA